VREYREMKEWFIEMGLEEEKILKSLWGKNLDRAKEKILKKLCKEKKID